MQHSRTNYKALRKFFSLVQSQGDPVLFGFSGNYCTFTMAGKNEYTVKFERYTITFRVNEKEKYLCPVHVEDWADGYNENAFVTGTSIPKARVMTKGDRALYEIGNRISFFTRKKSRWYADTL